jgi:hypothetical protein
VAEKHENGNDRAAGSAQGWLTMPRVLTSQAQNQQQHVWQMAQQQQQAFQRIVHGSVSTCMHLLFGAPRLPSQEGSRVARGGSEGAKELPSTTGQGLPIEAYDELSVSEVRKKIDQLSISELTELRKYEKRHKNRPTLVPHVGRKMSELNGERITKLLMARLNAKQQSGPRRKSGAILTS